MAEEKHIDRREFIKSAGVGTLVALLGGTAYGLSQAGERKQESQTFIESVKSKLNSVSLDDEALIDDKLKESGIDLRKVSTFQIQAESSRGFARTSFAVVGRTEKNSPRMFILDTNKNLTELKFWRTPDERGETVNWYIPGEDEEGGKGIPGVIGMQDVLAYRIEDGKLGEQIYYLPPQDELPILTQKEDLGGHMIPVDSAQLTLKTEKQLLEVKLIR